MKASATSAFQQDPPVFLLKDLTTRALESHEYPLASELLEQQHYLGDCPKGRQLLQVIEFKGHWVALLDWGPSCWKLADREDDTRSKNYNLNCNLAGLRVCLIAIKSIVFPEQSWSSAQERCQTDPAIAYRAIIKLRAKSCYLVTLRAPHPTKRAGKPSNSGD